MNIRTFKKPVTYNVLLSLTILSSSAHSAQLCEYGRLTFLQLAGGGSSVVRVAVKQGKDGYSNLKRKTGDTYATEMTYGKSSVRWADRLALLSLAHATRSKVSIYSSDNNCMGPMDEFEITLLD